MSLVKKNGWLVKSLIVVQAIQLTAFPLHAETSTSSTQDIVRSVAPGVAERVLEQIRQNKITTSDQFFELTKTLSLEDRMQFYTVASDRLNALQAELSEKRKQANSEGRVYIDTKLLELVSVSTVLAAFSLGGLHYGIMSKDTNISSSAFYRSQNYTAAQKGFLKMVGALGLISGAVTIGSQAARAVVVMGTQVSEAEIIRLQDEISKARHNSRIFLADILAAKEIEKIHRGDIKTQQTSSSHSSLSYLTLDSATQRVLRESLASSSIGAETFIEKTRNLSLQARRALFRDAARIVAEKEAELRVAIENSRHSELIRLNGIMSELGFMTAGLAAMSTALLSGQLINDHSIAPGSIQAKWLRGLRILAVLSVTGAVASAGGAIYSGYEIEATRPQVEELASQLKYYQAQLALVQKALAEIPEQTIDRATQTGTESK